MTADSPEILLITTAADAASDSVARLLDVAGARYARIDTESFPLHSTSTTWLGSGPPHTSWRGETPFDLANLRSVWLRRHRLPLLGNMDPAHAEYCLRESEWYVRGLTFAIHARRPSVNWMSSPLALWQAESKMRQLQAAALVGLECAATIVSNDPIEIRKFLAQHGPIVAKPLKLGYFDYGDTQAATFTTAITSDALAEDSALIAAPVIYQSHITKQFDVRITIVGDDIFAATIDSQSEPSAMTDWRQTEKDLRHELHHIPNALQQACHNLMRELDLQFGALDFVLTPDGRYIFLEVNPSGQWLWIEEKLGLPVTAAVAAWLMRSAS